MGRVQKLCSVYIYLLKNQETLKTSNTPKILIFIFDKISKLRPGAARARALSDGKVSGASGGRADQVGGGHYFVVV